LIIEGKIEGKRGIGRKKMSWLRNVRQWTGLRTIQELMHTIRRKREEWTNVIANNGGLRMDTQQKKISLENDMVEI